MIGRSDLQLTENRPDSVTTSRRHRVGVNGRRRSIGRRSSFDWTDGVGWWPGPDGPREMVGRADGHDCVTVSGRLCVGVNGRRRSIGRRTVQLSGWDGVWHRPGRSRGMAGRGDGHDCVTVSGRLCVGVNGRRRSIGRRTVQLNGWGGVVARAGWSKGDGWSGGWSRVCDGFASSLRRSERSEWFDWTSDRSIERIGPPWSPRALNVRGASRTPPPREQRQQAVRACALGRARRTARMPTIPCVDDEVAWTRWLRL